MQKFILTAIVGLLSILALVIVSMGEISADNVEKVECQTGVTLLGHYADVIVNGADCVLDGAIVNGSVIMNGGTLIATGGTIYGNILAKSAGDVTLKGAMVLGAVNLELSDNLIVDEFSTVGSVSMKESEDLTIIGHSTAGNVGVEKSGEVAISDATVGSVSNKESETTTLTNSTVYPGGITLLLATGDLTICGSEIGLDSDLALEGSGGINVTESISDVLVEETCGASTIVGSVTIGKGEGNISLIEAQLSAGDLIVTDQKGDVTVDGTLLGEINVGKTTGTVAINDVTTESDVTIAQNSTDVTINTSEINGDVSINENGSVTLQDVNTQSDLKIASNGDVTVNLSTFVGDASIAGNKKVTLTNSEFSLEDVVISKNSGAVLVEGNSELSLTVIENVNVTVTNNTFTDAEVSKNRGGTAINDNNGEKLSCSGNRPAPTGSGNIMTELKDGQCRSL